MQDDESELLELLRTPGLGENDIVCYIDCLETLLCVEAVPELVKILVREDLSLQARQRTAEAIRVLGSEYAAQEIAELRIGATSTLNQLLDKAEGK